MTANTSSVLPAAKAAWAPSPFTTLAPESASAIWHSSLLVKYSTTEPVFEDESVPCTGIQGREVLGRHRLADGRAHIVG